MKINPLDFNQRATFGVNRTTGNNPKNGNPIKGFTPSFSRWFGFQKQSMNQRYTLEGNGVTDTVVIAIRHDLAVKKTFDVKIGDDVYSIYDISPDNSAGYNKFDVITLQKVTKNG